MKLILKYWYATVLPGILGLLFTTVGLLIMIKSPLGGMIVMCIGIGLVLCQIIAWAKWYFSKKGTTDSVTVVKDGPSDAVIDIREGNFMLPRITLQDEDGKPREILAAIEIVPRIKQAAFGPEPYAPEEIGHPLKDTVDYVTMTAAEMTALESLGYTSCLETDPLNCTATSSTPKIKLDLRIADPKKLLEAGGLTKALGQLADKIAMYYQALVAGMSPAFINKNAGRIASQLDTLMENELEHRGLKIELGNGFGITDHGAPEKIRDQINEKTLAEKEGDANIARIEKEAKAAEAAKKKTVTDAEAQARAIELKATAEAQALKLRFDAMKDAGISGADIARILTQEATTSGIPNGVRDVILQGNNNVELWREVGEDNAGPKDQKKK